MTLHTKTIAEMANDLATKQYSAVELTTHFLNRIKQYDQQLNSYITITEDAALQAAKQADIARQQGTAHALAGIPIAQKDIFCTKDVKTSCGSLMLDKFIAPYDATLMLVKYPSFAICR
jgi:aspartyl-tRNA(Asn)/glutamyl-tRNA(Gln) amidotransferase subunit A